MFKLDDSSLKSNAMRLDGMRIENSLVVAVSSSCNFPLSRSWQTVRISAGKFANAVLISTAVLVRISRAIWRVVIALHGSRKSRDSTGPDGTPWPKSNRLEPLGPRRQDA